MSEEYVSRNEFNQLRDKVDKLEKTMESSEKLLQAIDKKVDVISNEITNANKIEELKIKPIEKDVEAIKDNNKWLWRTIIAVAIGLIANFIFK